MRTVPPSVVLALLAALAPACIDTGDCGPPNTESSTVTYDMSPDEFARYAGDDGALDAAECDAVCNALGIDAPESCASEVIPAPAGDTGDTAASDTGSPGEWHAITCVGVQTQYCLGRPPAGLTLPRAVLPDVGAWAAFAAATEAVSVRAFVDLDRHLARFAAPPALRARARAAAEDERRHTRAMVRLARRRGAPVRPLPVAPTPAPTLDALALDNLVHGCVEETWSALVAGWQAAHAADPDLRATLAAIAPDEARHAALAWDLHRWFTDQGAAPDARSAIDAALARIRAAVDAQDPTLAAHLGLPHGADAERLLATLERELWAA